MPIYMMELVVCKIVYPIHINTKGKNVKSKTKLSLFEIG